MEKTSAHGFGVTPAEEAERARAIIPEAPGSGVRLKRASEPLRVIRQLARNAESLGLDPLAFELLFAAARIESGGPVDAVRSELAETAELVSELEARFYRRAVRSLAAAASTG
jgi:hypothetical protein